MSRFRTTALGAVNALVAMTFTGCGGSDTARDTPYVSAGQAVPSPAARPAPPRAASTKRIGARDLVAKLEAAGLGVQDLGPAELSVDNLSRFPEEPRSTLQLRVSYGRGNSTPMTFVEFSSWKAAAELDAKPINGFAVRNWFMLGIVSNDWVELVKNALAE